MKYGYLPHFGETFADVKTMSELLNCEAVQMSLSEDMFREIDVFVLFGGEDISPALYHQKPVFTSAPDQLSHRDMMELQATVLCNKVGVPIVGICRGAQLLCALLGGKLWQHVDHHEGEDHPIVVNGVEYMTNSYHHQMMIPTPNMEVIGFTPCRSVIKCAEDPIVDRGDEAEILFHAGGRALMIQGHPEWTAPDHDLYKLTQRLVKEKLWA